jgi:histidyl-tRNA synthetase
MTDQFLTSKPYKGTRDFYPDEMRMRAWVFSTMRRVAEDFGYEEMSGPIVERFDLYAAKSGEELVNEQIYHFEDKSGRRLAIRPEMTPTVARMVAARLEQLTLPLRWYSIANFMRYERPQKGRLREHWQLNVDVLGESTVRADAEIIGVVAALMRSFGADGSMFRIKISDRRLFNDVLRNLLDVGDNEIQTISKAVDKRAKISREDYEAWLAESGIAKEKIALLDDVFESSLSDIAGRLSSASQGAESLETLFSLLDQAGVSDVCQFDFAIVRGFDYYTGMVFEVEDASPDNRRSLFGGGRYDNLVGLFRKSEVSGVGFGFGDVTFQDFLTAHGLIPSDLGGRPTALIVTFDGVAYAEYLKLAEELRSGGIANAVYFDQGAKLKKQMQFAERKGFALAVLLGEDELASGKIVVKQMASRRQLTLDRADCVEQITKMLEDT